jgi:hypothetical protein
MRLLGRALQICYMTVDNAIQNIGNEAVVTNLKILRICTLRDSQIEGR